VLIGATALIWAASLVFVYFDSREEVGEMLDAHLAQSAAMLLARSEAELGRIETEHAPQLHRYARKVVFQVWANGADLRVHSPNAPPTRLSAREEGFSESRIDGKRWRVFSAWSSERRFLVQVAERTSARDEISGGVVKQLVGPMLLALPVLALAIWFVVSRALRPIRTVSTAVQRRDPARLDPVEAPDAPREIAPLVESINRLFERVTASLDKERRFTADAAHELRTPLAALRAQAQVARTSADDARRNHALDLLILGCDRASHLVDQMLTLARLDAGSPPSAPQRCDLRAIASDIVAQLTPLAMDKEIEIELNHAGATMVDAEPALLGILVRNLVDNAVRYSPPGEPVTVTVLGEAGRVILAVEDRGPGIAPPERERVWDRFYRIAGSDTAGSGLGMSIVRRIADQHGASITLADGDAERGLRVTVAFSAACAV